MDYSADIGIFLSDDGIPAVISEEGKLDKSTTILFDRLSTDQMGILTDKPQATIPTADLTGFSLTKLTLTVSGVAYKLMKPLDDGAGFTLAGLKGA